MSELKIVLYRENRCPRSIALSSGTIYRTLFAAACLGLIAAASTAVAVKYYLVARENVTRQISPNTNANGTTGSLAQQNATLRDQVEQLKARLDNASRISNARQKLDKENPALALFAPIVSDHTRSQDQVVVNSFHYTQSTPKTPATLTFELANAHPGETTEKGYIVVLARSEDRLLAYPNVFNGTGPYLLDFEKGETFQVARFRMVNAQFQGNAQRFQILIFARNGDLLINRMYEVKKNGG